MIAHPTAPLKVASRLADELTSNAFQVRFERHLENRGGAAALRTNFSAAAGEFVCWLSADDAFIRPEKTRRQLEVARRGADVVYDARFFTGAEPDTAEEVAPHWSDRRTWLDALFLWFPTWRLLALNFRGPINGSSTRNDRREALTEFGLFDTVLRNIDQDGDMWLRYSALGARFRSVDQSAVFYRLHDAQTSQLTSEVHIGCSTTRLRVLDALATSGRLRVVLNRGRPALLLQGEGRFRMWPAVSQGLVVLGVNSRCGIFSRLALRHVRRVLTRTDCGRKRRWRMP